MGDHCRKCGASALRVHLLSGGFCQECQGEYDWKNAPRVIHQQKMKGQRMAHFRKGERLIKKKWKEEFGDASVEEVQESRGY